MTDEFLKAFDDFLKPFDDLDNAAARVLTAQPFQMTEAAEALDAARKRARKLLWDLGMKRPSP